MASSLQIQQAAKVLRQGGVIAYPTEAVWGLGCDPHDERAINRLLAIKQRPAEKGLILIAASLEQFAPYLEGLDAEQLAILELSWPGPITFIVPDNGYTPELVRGNHRSVALRVTAHRQTAELCRCFGGPIVSTSANRAGLPAAKWPWQVQRQLAGKLDYQLSGQLGRLNKPTEIRDLLTGKTIRVS